MVTVLIHTLETKAMSAYLSTSDLAQFLDTDTWRIRRLFEDGTLPEPPRIARLRAIPRDRIPEIVDALRDRGWLRQAEAATA